MTKKLIILSALVLGSICGWAQQEQEQPQEQPKRSYKKPTLMILPSDNWCTQRYFMTTFDNQGSKVQIPDYQTAFREDTELGAVISKVGQLLTNLGYSLKDAEQEIKSLSMREAEDHVTTGKNSGASLMESPLDMLKRRTKTDIIIQIGWQVNKENFGKSVTFTLEAFDSYTNKRIATATGTGMPADEIVPVLLEDAVKTHIMAFDYQMDLFFSQTIQNGREIVLTIRRWNDWQHDLETEFDDETLLDHIQNWLQEHTVNAQFNLTDATENMAQFEQVHIPVTNEKGRAVDARSFTVELQRHLRSAPFNIASKVSIRGLGEAMLILGEQ